MALVYADWRYGKHCNVTVDSSFNSMATVSTVDFYQKYFRPDESGEHYLKVSRAFTLVWAVLIIVPAILFSRSEGSILETLSKVGNVASPTEPVPLCKSLSGKSHCTQQKGITH